MAHWHIAGVGAIGSLWAHKLSNTGHTVSLILKDTQQLERYEVAGGISLHTNGGETLKHYFPAALASNINHPIEQLLVCCKSWQSVAVLTRLQHVLNTDSRVVLLQNGLGQLYESKPLLEHCAFYCASTTDGVFKNGDFSVTLAGKGNTLMGPFNNAAKLNKIKIGDTQWQSGIETVLWKKLCINAVINPLTALYDVNNGGLLTIPNSAQIIGSLCKEISNIALATEQDLTTEKIQKYVYEIAEQTATNSSSMREDINAGQRSEILEINGYLIELAKTKGIATPLNQQLMLAINAKSPTEQSPQPTT